VIIREVTTEDEDKVRTLFALCFGKELSREEWAWKYKDAPWGSTAAVAVDGEDIIAHYGGMKTEFYFRGKTFMSFQPCDVMTHPRYRSRIFSKRGAMVQAGEHFYRTNPMDFAFGFPSERHAILGTKQLGYTAHDYVTAMNKYVSGFRPLRNPFLRIETGWDCIRATELDALWAEVRDTTALSIDKNSRYIFWRYRDNPVRRYVPVMVRSRYTKRTRAFAVCAVGEDELSVLDFFCTGGFKLGTLLKVFEHLAAKHDLHTVKGWINPDEDIFQTFIENGYVQEKGVPFIFKIINKEVTSSFLFSHYCYRMGDYDAS
jgi:hypothetical protein